MEYPYFCDGVADAQHSTRADGVAGKRRKASQWTLTSLLSPPLPSPTPYTAQKGTKGRKWSYLLFLLPATHSTRWEERPRRSPIHTYIHTGTVEARRASLVPFLAVGSRKRRPSVHDARTPQSHTNDLAPPFIPSKVTSPIGACCDWPLGRDGGLVGEARHHSDAAGVASRSDRGQLVGEEGRWSLGLLQARTNLSVRVSLLDSVHVKSAHPHTLVHCTWSRSRTRSRSSSQVQVDARLSCAP